MKRIAHSSAVVLITLLAACTEESRVQSLVVRFHAEAAAYEELKEMVLEESLMFEGVSSRYCLGVGLDVIGRYYLGDAGWVEELSGGPALPLEQVLERYAITQSRYERYQALFEQTGTEKVDYCELEGMSWVRVLDWGKGPLMRDCLAIFTSGVEPASDLKSLDQNIIGYNAIVLNDDWYLDHGCD